MAAAKGSYTYPTEIDDDDHRDVLKNKFGVRTHSELREREYPATFERQVRMRLGEGPTGNFDEAHLKAVHRFLFEEVFEWAGHFRNERVRVEGQQVEPVGAMSKGGDHFLHGSRIEMGLNEALRPIRNRDVLRGSTPRGFAEVAGAVMGELNYVHPFREGNGRTTEAFIAALGREYGHEVRFSLISEPRMIAVSKETSANPSSQAMIQLICDATDPGRQTALQAVFDDLRRLGEDPLAHDVRTAQPGEVVSGQILGSDARDVWLVTDTGVVVGGRADLPADLPSDDRDITFEARSDFARASGGERPD
ncbi:Fic family protein [Afifella sp. JA880]|uniref:Fic/DOC family protein n=1 Tax=Afifella sp. JA880 TaxID=2975280 RepID=UPI0021BB4872|nr:Fic family protein [Afifella sp. JA880]MCT8268564.1 Fic family protein [Afifella sp. JA880]